MAGAVWSTFTTRATTTTTTTTTSITNDSESDTATTVRFVAGVQNADARGSSSSSSSSSDYGSDFDSEDDRLLTELLLRVSSATPDPNHASSQDSTGGSQAPALSLPHRFLGQPPRDDEVDQLGRYAALDVVNPVAEVVRDDSDNAGPVRSTESVAEDQPMTLAAAGEETLAEGADAVVDTRSPLERFRSPPKKPLSVTDLISPSWCELQYWYTLTKHGRKRRTAAMKQGSAVHKTLEDQVHRTVVVVSPMTREDACGLRIWNVVQGLRTLRATGMTRELEVWGLIDGEVVNGVIDELSYRCPDRVLEAEADDAVAAGEVETLAETGVAGTGRRAIQHALDRYLKKSSGSAGGGGGGGGGGGIRQDHVVDDNDHSNGNSQSTTTTTEHNNKAKIYITDIKTRTTRSIPTGIAFRPTYLQLMIYHRLLSDLAADRVDAKTIFARYRLDGSATFTDSFLAEIGQKLDDDSFSPDHHDGLPSSSSSSSFSSTNPAADSLSLSQLTSYNTLHSLWTLMIHTFRLTFPLGASSIGHVLQAEYHHQNPTTTNNNNNSTTILGAKTFLHDPVTLQTYLDDEMSWWKGQRAPLGVPIEEAYKCRLCDFADECWWRRGKAVESVSGAGAGAGRGRGEGKRKSVV